MDLRIRIPNTELSFYIQRLYRLLDVSDPNITLFIQSRIHDNEHFIDDCYIERCFIINYAVKIGNIDIVSALFDIAGFSRYLEKKDETHRTPLDWAIYNNDTQMSMFLISNGANIGLRNVRSILWNMI